MDAKFTPGPLCVEDCTSAEPVDVCLAYDVPGGGSPIVVATCFFDEDDVPAPITRSQAIANAKLYAAAPELYEALKLCLSELEERFDLESSSTNPGIKVAANKARAALAKAT